MSEDLVPAPRKPRRVRANGNGHMSVADLRSLSNLLGRFNFASKAGITFKGQRDLFEALGYKRILEAKDFRDRYQRNGIAARVIESLPQATWRAGCAVIEDEDPENITVFEQAWTDLAERLNIWAALLRADVLAGFGRYSVLFIGAPGELNLELPSKMRPEDVMYMTPYSEDEARISRFVEDPKDERYGLPLMYALQRRTVNTNSSSASQIRQVHWTRVVHVADGLLDDRVYGQPRLERIWNWLDDLEKITGAGAEAFWLRAHQGFHYDLDKDLTIDDTAKTELKDAAEEFANGLRRTISTRGMKVTALGSDVANFNNQVDAIITLIAGSTGIPKRILVGSERGELASSQDKTNWDERVSDRREQFAEPQVLRPLVDLLIERGVLPTPESYHVLWPDVATMTDLERADMATKWAGLNRASGGVVVLDSEIRDRVLELEPLEQAQIDEATPAPSVVVAPVVDPNAGTPLPPQQDNAALAAARRRSMLRRWAAARGKDRPRSNRGTSEFTRSQIRIVRRSAK